MATLLTESFETDGNGSRYTTSVPEFSDGANDFFGRTDGSTISSAYSVTGADGDFYFAAQDLDGEGALLPLVLSFTGIDISGFSNLSFSGLFAEDAASDGNQDWDASDFVQIEYQIDGGGFQPLLAFENDGSTFNSAAFQDTDFDGIGDGPSLTDTFSLFSAAIAGMGSSLDLRLIFDLNAGDEDIAIDALMVSGDSSPGDSLAPLISEFQPNPSGNDAATQIIELSGTPGAAFSGWIVSLESDTVATLGTVDRATEITGTFDANGLLTVAIPDLENPSFTVALVERFTGTVGTTDIDPNNDGIADDLSAFGTVLDAIGVPDASSDVALLYGSDLGGSDFAYTGDEPRLIFRDASRGNLYAINDPDNGAVFDITGTDVTPALFETDPTAGTDTFGVLNPTVTAAPETSLAIAAVTPSQLERDSGTTDFTFTVTRSGAISSTTDVDFAVTSGDADAADFGGTLPAGTIRFAANETSRSLTLSVSGDTTIEPDESFTVTLSNPSGGATLTTATATATILNDDLAITKIHTIQGAGSASPFEGQLVTLDAIVVGDFQDGGLGSNGDLNGFFLQEEDTDTDGNDLTSEGLFVFDGFSPAVDVKVGDRVQVTGTVAEFFGLTELTQVTDITVISSGNSLPTAAVINLPAVSTVTNADGELIADLEAYEGMLATFPDTLTVTELFNLDRFGELRVSEGGRLEQFTQNNAPDVAGFEAHLRDIARRTITLDDGQTRQNPDPIVYPDGSLSTADAFRMGDTVTDLTGVVTFSRGSGGFGDETYRLHPTVAPQFVSTTPRPQAPTAADLGNPELTIASFNVLNYFTTLDDGSTLTDAGLSPRGADDLTRFGGDPPAGTDADAEFNRQTQKLVTALAALDADVLGLVELENSNTDAAIAALTAELNTAVAGSGRTYQFISTPGLVGTDAITVGMVYDANAVTPVGAVAILDDPSFTDPNNTGPD